MKYRTFLRYSSKPKIQQITMSEQKAKELLKKFHGKYKVLSENCKVIPWTPKRKT